MSVSFSTTAKEIVYRDRDEVYGLEAGDKLGNLAYLLNKAMLEEAINNNSEIGSPLTTTEVAELTTIFQSLDYSV